MICAHQATNRAGGTCREFGPVFKSTVAHLQPRYAALQIGQVDIDTEQGMQLATDTGAIEVGVPSLRLYGNRDAESQSDAGKLVWADEEVPSEQSLLHIIDTALQEANVAESL